MADAEEWIEWDVARARDWIAVPRSDDDKYSRGVLGVITGSHDYPGAAVLGVEAAMRTGVGMVRYTGPRAVAGAVLARRPEVVTISGRVQAWLLGSGMNPARRTLVLSGELSQAIGEGHPIVLDAGALDLVGETHGAAVITPHYRELAALLGGRKGPTVEEVAENPGEWAIRAAEALGATVLLKGAVTHIAQPDGIRLTVSSSPGWLATAGTGDVLGGVLGALLATHHEVLKYDPSKLAPLSATAALLHGLAARRASGGGPIAALDVAQAIPATIAALLARSEG
ncbi:ADP-dependent NAD(P)H-hydrate dehydratase [Luethyella okanaganae]|uniref:ADP-dependent (S)-NAD(P)H-hydrate dehydratase n=1 Tax=Luethyella okanaganae TaxID=69372 RepID=A0ABW1VBD5_9MICO